jgi:transposase
MPLPYSIDLRSRVIDLLKSGKTQLFISNLLDISTKTIQRWCKLQNLGNIAHKKPIRTRTKKSEL